MTAARIEAVERSVEQIRGNIGEELSLQDLARAALLSPFHFHRVFCQITDTTPARYLAACRMAEAKRLLVSGSESVTDICWQVGYSSLGTFTSQFTRLVGVPPGRFRQLATVLDDESFDDVLERLRDGLPDPEPGQLSGSIDGCPVEGRLALVGLFSCGIPQQRPAACSIVEVPSPLEFSGLSDGEYHPLAVSCAPGVRVSQLMTGDADRFLYVASGSPIHVKHGKPVSTTPLRLRLRARGRLDPPLVLVLPFLVLQEMRATSDT